MVNKVKPTSRRALARESTRDEILECARQQIAHGGVASLSLREIARKMRVTAPAIYRYFKSRDEIIAALAATAYASFADTLQAACDAAPADDHKQRLLAIGLAYRKWALAHPQDYMLIFGTPIPDFVDSKEIVVPEARRAIGILMNAIDSAWHAGAFGPPQTYTNPPAILVNQLNAWKKTSGINFKTPVLHLALSVWSRVHGLVSLELVGQIPGFVGSADTLYQTELLELGRQLGLRLK